MEKFLSSPEGLATNKPNYNNRFGLNKIKSSIKNDLVNCLMRFLFFSRATFFRRCLQRVVMVVILFFITPLISCIDSEGNTYYSIKVSASDFIEDNIDYNNIYNLWEQPLRVIKKTVEGEWKIETFSSPSGSGVFKNTFVKITEDSVIITKAETDPVHIIPDSFSYRWEIREMWHYSTLSGQVLDSVLRSIYVMVSDDKTIEWNFLDIENSRLRGKNFESGKIFMFFRNN